MSEATIIIRADGPILHVINNNPSSKNSLSAGFIDGFTELLESIEPSLDKARIIILSGAEGFFCSGGNLDGLKQRSESDYDHRRSNVDKINKMILLMRSCPLPIIAAVEGGAAGAGVGLALACDMIFAAEETFFMAAYVKIGITPDGGMTPFMAEAIPRWLFAQMVFTGDKMPVQRLYQMGVVNEITAKNAAVSSAIKMAERLAKGPAQALAMGKALISSARLSPLGAQLEEEAHIVATALGSKDAREGINAFLEKRAPNFS
ncbi:enoyl-CoA hydratase-related protein [Alphaproteobacteria bacterium]|nr:enoyl-CoA hydratase-related protein [Alphaproteobacteria bacterium]